MTKQKKGFLLFIASLIPGAGELYMGFRKMGLSLMILFWGCIAIASFFSFNAIIFLLPIIWFYSFFNTHNLKSLSEEEFHSIEDKLILPVDGLIQNKELFLKRYRNAIAILLIFIGVVSLCNVGSNWLYQILGVDEYYLLVDMARQIPAVILSVFLIVFGIHLIRGKYEALESEETSTSSKKTLHSNAPQKADVTSTKNNSKSEAAAKEPAASPQKEADQDENA